MIAATGASLLTGGAATALAQDTATPELTPADALTGYLELQITATDTALTLPEQIPAGRYLVTIENQATLGESAPAIFLIPEGREMEEMLTEEPDPTTGLPAWLPTVTIVGAPIAPAGTTAQAIVDFVPGRYAVWGEPFQESVELEVVPGSTTSPPEPVAGAAITIGDGALTGVPEQVSPGKHLWQVTSTGGDAHRFQLYGYPEAITLDELVAALPPFVQGTPSPPGGPDLSLAVQLGGLGVLSTGQTAWPVLDLSPGTYFAMCTLGSSPHFLAGEIAVFAVGDGQQPAGTPTR